MIAVEDRTSTTTAASTSGARPRALWADIRGQGSSRAGRRSPSSTSRTRTRTSKRTVTRKVREAILASQLDRQTTRTRSSSVPVDDLPRRGRRTASGAAARDVLPQAGQPAHAVGGGAARRRHPGAQRLRAPRATPTEAETRRKRRARARCSTSGCITQQQYDAGRGPDVWLAVRGKPPARPRSSTRPSSRQTKYPYFVDYVSKYLDRQVRARQGVPGRPAHPDHASIPKLQDEAEKAVADSSRAPRRRSRWRWPRSSRRPGFVKAIVGGRDFYAAVRPGEPGPRAAACSRRAEVKVDVPATCWDAADVRPGRRRRAPARVVVQALHAGHGVRGGHLAEQGVPGARRVHVPHCAPAHRGLHGPQQREARAAAA